MKIGDKVRFANEVGGGTVSAFKEGGIVMVRDSDGFDIPMLRSQVVVIDEGKDFMSRPPLTPGRQGKKASPEATAPSPKPQAEQAVTFRPRPTERRGGDTLNILLGFIPWGEDGETFRCYIVNDSNYYLHAALFTAENNASLCRFMATVEPNTKLPAVELRRSELNLYERLRLQALVYKTSKPFLPQPPVSVDLRLETVKFYRPGSFVPTPFFKAPALLADIVRDGRPRTAFPPLRERQ